MFCSTLILPEIQACNPVDILLMITWHSVSQCRFQTKVFIYYGIYSIHDVYFVLRKWFRSMYICSPRKKTLGFLRKRCNCRAVAIGYHLSGTRPLKWHQPSFVRYTETYTWRDSCGYTIRINDLDDLIKHDGNAITVLYCGSRQHIPGDWKVDCPR